MESFQASGLWYVPNSPDRLVAGTLDFSRTQGLRLRLSGVLNESISFNESHHYEAVFGLLESSPLGRFVLASNCLRVTYSMRMPGYATEELTPTIAFISAQPLENGGIEAREAEIRLLGLDEWARVGRGLDLKTQHDDSLLFSYSQPRDLILEIERTSCSLRFIASWLRSPSTFEFHQHAAWILSFPERLSVDSIRAIWLAPFQNMLSWMIDRPSGVIDLSLIVSDKTEEARSIHVLYSPIYWGAEEELSGHDMLVTLKDFEDSFESVVREWWDFSGRFRRFCEVFFSLQSSPPRFVEMRFAWLLRAASAFASAQDQKYSSHRFDTSIAAENLSQYSSQRAEYLLSAAQELALPEHIESLVEQGFDLAQAIVGPSVSQFVERILRARSAVLAGSGPTSFSGQEILWTGEQLAMLMKIAIGNQLPSLVPRLRDCFTRNSAFLHLAQRVQAGAHS
jgi:hypothetical protein